jgi:hypothetical protein
MMCIDTSRFSSSDVSWPGFRRGLARVAITCGTLISTGIAVDSGAAKLIDIAPWLVESAFPE